MDERLSTRRGARVLVLDAADRVLLLRGADPQQPAQHYWFTVGGGLDDGETDAEGAARELFEETGLRAEPAALTGPVHREVVEFCFDGRPFRQDQVYFVLRVSTFDINTSGFEAVEHATIDAHRWWSAAELRTTTQTCYPPDLAEVLDRVLADEH